MKKTAIPQDAAKKQPRKKHKTTKQPGETTQLFAMNAQGRGDRPTGGLPFSPISAATTAPRNETGLPDHIKSGAEHHSGISLNDVRVHYNSPKPATMQAHAYTQGNQIHIASGQERHLGHETWHAVQQKQNRVTPNCQLKGLNDSPVLEKEADAMGETLEAFSSPPRTSLQLMSHHPIGNNQTIQRKTIIRNKGRSFSYLNPDQLETLSSKDRNNKSKHGGIDKKNITVGQQMIAYLDPEKPVAGTEASANDIKGGQADMMGSLKMQYGLEPHQLIRGHLLNAKLGGLADNNNLFPISSDANKEHESTVERVVKGLAWNEEIRKSVFGNHDDSKKIVYYKVDVAGDADNYSTENAFDCSWGLTNAENIEPSAKTTKRITSKFVSPTHPDYEAAIEAKTAQKLLGGRTKLGKKIPNVNEQGTLRTSDSYTKEVDDDAAPDVERDDSEDFGESLNESLLNLMNLIYQIEKRYLGLPADREEFGKFEKNTMTRYNMAYIDAIQRNLNMLLLKRDFIKSAIDL